MYYNRWRFRSIYLLKPIATNEVRFPISLGIVPVKALPTKGFKERKKWNMCCVSLIILRGEQVLYKDCYNVLEESLKFQSIYLRKRIRSNEASIPISLGIVPFKVLPPKGFQTITKRNMCCVSLTLLRGKYVIKQVLYRDCSNIL